MTTLEELTNNYQLTGDPNKFHEDLLVYYNFSITPVLSIATERQLLNTRGMKICSDYSINYPTFLKNLTMLTDYQEANRLTQ